MSFRSLTGTITGNIVDLHNQFDEASVGVESRLSDARSRLSTEESKTSQLENIVGVGSAYASNTLSARTAALESGIQSKQQRLSFTNSLGNITVALV